MDPAKRSLLVTFQSTRPLYCVFTLFVGFVVLTSKMSGTLDNPLPTPGCPKPAKVGSRVPSGVPSGDPTFRPCPGMVTQFTPSVSPTPAQVAGRMELKLGTASPG